jgi:hypothetical protein
MNLFGENRKRISKKYLHEIKQMTNKNGLRFAAQIKIDFIYQIHFDSKLKTPPFSLTVIVCPFLADPLSISLESWFTISF